MKELILTRGKVALVDDRDYERLLPFAWYALKTEWAFYAAYHGPLGSFYMHRLILNAPKGVKVDHRDGNGLNNQRFNLRLAPYSGNHANSKPHRDNQCGFKGVFMQDGKYWRARIQNRGKPYHVGYFPTAIDAARAYDKKAIQIFGEFAKTNAQLGLL